MTDLASAFEAFTAAAAARKTINAQMYEEIQAYLKQEATERSMAFTNGHAWKATVISEDVPKDGYRDAYSQDIWTLSMTDESGMPYAFASGRHDLQTAVLQIAFRDHGVIATHDNSEREMEEVGLPQEGFYSVPKVAHFSMADVKTQSGYDAMKASVFVLIKDFIARVEANAKPMAKPADFPTLAK